jgi:hypothetical protein
VLAHQTQSDENDVIAIEDHANPRVETNGVESRLQKWEGALRQVGESMARGVLVIVSSIYDRQRQLHFNDTPFVHIARDHI